MMCGEPVFSARDIPSPVIDDILVGTSVEEGKDFLEAHLRDLCRVYEILGKDILVTGKDKTKLFVKSSILWTRFGRRYGQT